MAVQQKMQLDGFDPELLNNPNSQQQAPNPASNNLPSKLESDHKVKPAGRNRQLIKYFKMINWVKLTILKINLLRSMTIIINLKRESMFRLLDKK